MLKSYLVKLLTENFDYEPTESQRRLISSLSAFITSQEQKQALVVRGYAGTGKTTLVSSLVKSLDWCNLRYVLLAPTGRAAKVLSAYSRRPAFTIHKKIYIQKSVREGMGIFALERNLHSNTFFIVDEASMITNQAQEFNIFGSGRLLNDLLDYVYNDKNCRLILIGDTAQLPPVGLDISPALDRNILEQYGLKVSECYLTDVIRQSLDSGILFNATGIREILDRQVFDFPVFTLKGYKDIIPLSGSDLIEELGRAYDQYGLDGAIVVTRSNKRANKYNQGIRNQILGREEDIAQGDFLMVVKNNYFWLDENQMTDFIANGDIAEIVRIHKYQEFYGFRFADVTLRFPDYQNMTTTCKIMLDTINIEAAALGQQESKALYQAILEDFPDIKSKRKQYEKVRDHPFFNALQIKFAYAVTCHKAQGGQWEAVFIDQGYITDEIMNLEYLRWLYTAFTRATKKLYLVNFASKYFGEG
ncbi:MAG: ATP-dependent endonuclease [Bacteroides sp. SM23_62_1]|nr:MAG: ATP-dependent endonuclease [Bacteroides sp. SM23_62_1]